MGSNSRPTQWTGGRGGSYSGGGPASANELEQSALYVTERSSFDSEVNDYFQSLLTNYNDRDVEAIKRHRTEIENALEDIDVESLLFGGSVARSTYINGYSDVDALAIVNEDVYRNKTPSEALEMIRDRIKQRYPNSKIKVGNLAVTIEFSDGQKIQLLPAIRTATGVRIVDHNTNQWSNVTRPKNFANQLTEVNRNNNKRVIPTIKLYKSINSQQPKDKQLSGYHIESLAIEAFRDYKGSYSNKDMLLHLSKYIKDNIKTNIKDSTGQSKNVDGYLGSKNSQEREKRRVVAANLYTVMDEAEKDRSLSRWKNIMEH